MVTNLEYALMAGRAYQTNRDPVTGINWFPVPTGWSEFFHVPNNPDFTPSSSGFEAVSFSRGTGVNKEIVISYAGTDGLFSVDNFANFGLATGFGAAQLNDAARYYLQVLHDNPGATITFTGHSLGGGLAALMGVFFGQRAVTFDQASFAKSTELSAVHPDVAANLKGYLLGQGYSAGDLSGLTNFIQERQANGGIPNTTFIKTFLVTGEFTSSTFPFSTFSAIGTETSLTHGPADWLGVSFDLHAQSLLATFVQNDQFRQVTNKLTDLLAMTFDSRLYANNTNGPNENFLERLVRHENGNAPGVTTADAMLTRFTNDLWKLAQDGGLTMADDPFASVRLVSQTLIAFAMQKYYTETQTSAGYNEELFTGVTGGVRFDRADVAAALTDAKGYTLYFHDYLANAFTPSDRDRIELLLPVLRDWYVQAGMSGMDATDTQSRGAFMLGGLGADSLTGGTGADLLVGNAGVDTLTGGGGDDRLLGGEGFDIYRYTSLTDGNDTIEDADARGMITVDGQMLVGGIKEAGHTDWTSPDGTITYAMSGTDLVVQLNGTTIMTINENFQSGQFGVRLIDETAIPQYDNGLPVATVSNQSYTELDNDHNYIYTASGESTIATRGGHDQIFGGILGEFISGGKGHDRIEGGGGNDTILGGSYFLLQEEDSGAEGDDVIDGQGGNDEIEGDGGDDHISGGDGSDRLFGDAGTFGSSSTPPGGDDFVDGGAGEDFLWGDYGADVLVGGDGDDRLTGDYLVHNDKGVPAPAPFVFDTTRAKDDFLNGGEGTDILYGDGGNDTLVGGAGNDSIYGDYGEGAFLAADGDLTNIAGNDVVDGGAGNDVIYGMGGDDVIGGGAGGDVIFGDFDKTIWPTATVFGDDVIDAGTGDDHASGGSGNDTLFGGIGNDRLWGDSSFLTETTSVGDDSLNGGAGEDILFGGLGNDRLEGGDGHDILIGTDHYEWNIADKDVLAGGAGDDRIYGQGGDDVLSGGAGTDILFGDDYYFVDQLPGPNVIGPGLLQGIVISTASGNDVLDGGADDDFLFGGQGIDRLTGGLGNDILNGGEGNDIYELNVGDGIDDVSDSGQGGNDTVLFGSGITASSVTLTPDAGRIFVKVGAGSDGILLGGVGDVFGSQTIEQFQFADGAMLTYSDLIARGFDLLGTANNDVLFGTNLTNRFVGGLGNDILFGGSSKDLYIFNSGDGIDVIVDISTPAGSNTVVFGPGITSAMLTLSVASDPDNGQANVLVVRPGSGTDATQLKNFDRTDVFGPHAVDSFQFADGTRLSYENLLSRGFDLVGTADNDTILGTDVTDRIMAGVGDDLLQAGAGDDLLDGNAGDDVLKGESGSDTYLFGHGSGHDRILDERGTADVVRLAPGILLSDVAITRSGDDLVLRLNQGADQLTVAHHFLLPKFRIEEIQFSDGSVLTSAFLDDPVIQGTEQDDLLNGTGSDDVLVGLGGNDQIASLAGDDVLDGGAGVDVLTGGAGNDTYVVGESGDVVIEALGEGSDTVQSSITYTLGSNVENLALTGSAVINGTGNTLDNVLTGNSTANVLTGGLGDDTYVVGAGDTVVELAGEGTDTVEAVTSMMLGANLENLNLTGSASLIGTGNSLDNVLSADGSVSVLAGGAGNDTYLIGPNLDDDILVETASGGVDTVITGHDYRLPDHLENLTLLDPRVPDFSTYSMPLGLLREDPPIPYSGQYLVGIGNGLDNVMTGGRANDRLDGGLGIDTMMGRTGHDVYIVDNSADVVVELAGEGVDTVETSVSYALSANVENLTLTGTGAINGTGNAMGNTMLGNDAANVLDGGAGNDILNGEEGADTFIFGLGSGADAVGDTTEIGAVDTVQVNAGLTPSNLVVFHRGEDLVLHISGTTDELALANFYGPSEWSFKQVRFADGTVWDAAELRARAVVVGGTGPGTIQNPADYLLPAIFENIFLADNFTNVEPYADDATGSALDNLIVGNTRDNVLDGGAGNDVLVGGLFRSFEGGIVIARTGSDTLIGGEGDDTLMADGGNITFPGASGGGGGFEEDVPRAADDLFIGGVGNDMYILHSQQETVVEFANEGTDTVHSTVDYVLGDNVENLTLLENPVIALPGAYTGTGNGLDNLLIGNSENNVLSGGAGNDTLWGGSGVYRDSETIQSRNDLLIGGAGNDTYLFNLGDGIDRIQDMMTVGEGNRVQFGVGIVQSALTFIHDEVSRTLTIQVGSSGADQLLLTNFNPTNANGSLVVETLAFADGSQASLASLLGGTINHAPKVATPLADQTVPEDAQLSITVPSNTFDDQDAGDVLALSASLADGSAIPPWLIFNATTQTFTGTPDDAQVGSVDLKVTATDSGNLSVSDIFTLTVQNVNDMPMVANLIPDQQARHGTAFNLTVAANTFADIDVGDVLTYSANRSSGAPLPGWLSFNPTTRTFTGTPQAGDIGSLDVRVTVTDTGALSTNDVFALTIAPSGGTPGNDIMVGTPGNDLLDGLAGDDTLQGLAGNDTLIGGAGNDLLDGGAGTDTMTGGTGNDTYIVSTGDTVAETANNGLDTVQSHVTWTLGANLEVLTLTGSANINGTGNTLNNILTGNSGVNVLTGGAGNDVYVINTGDTVVEGTGAGTDTVLSDVTTTLGANVELLVLMGTNAINGTGNSLANTITGNNAANILNGGSGADILAGLDGNDTYMVDNAGDLVFELANNGIDQVQSSVTYTLTANVENLTVTGTMAINGTGNGLNNVLTGNSAANRLTGADGTDSLRGNGGNDTLNGGNGNDIFLFGHGDGQDLIQDNSGAADRLLFDGGVNPLDLIISRQANNLRLAIHGGTDQVTIQNWYTSPVHRVETIQAGNGQTLLNSQVDQLIQAMAGFTQQSGLTWDQALNDPAQVPALQNILAANWQ